MKKFSIGFLLFIFLIPAVSFGADLTGTWYFNGTGYVGQLKIVQTGNSIEGTVYGDTIIQGTVGGTSGREVKFTRKNDYLVPANGAHPQLHIGYLFTKGPMVMAGTIKHRNSSEYGWYAIKR